jgi:4-amino-4-deoxy-L-arabinose transferase-like glycosyltransferase
MNDRLTLDRNDSTAVVSVRQIGLLAWMFAIAVSLAGLWSGSLHPWDEALSAERAREMLVTGDWLTPHFQYVPDFNKPPLYYWLTAIFFKLFGIDELTVRLGSALLALGCLALCQRAASRLGGTPAAGLLAMWLLASNPHWINLTREGRLDSGMALGMALCLALLLRRPKRPRDPWLAGVALGLAMLIKTPLALAILFPAALGLVIEGRWRDAWRRLALALAVAAAIALPWYGAQLALWGWTYVRQFFIGQHWSQFLNRFGRPEETPWYFLAQWAGRAPFSFAALVLAAVLAGRRRREERALAAWWLAAAMLLGTLSLSRVKYNHYLVLIYPFAAVCSAAAIGRAMRDRLAPPSRRWCHAALAFVSLALFFPYYRTKLDGAPDQKVLARAILKTEGPDARFLTFSMPVNCLLFYSKGRVYRANDSFLANEMQKLTVNGSPPLLVVAEKARVASVRAAAATIQPVPRITRVRSVGSLVLLRIEAADVIADRPPPSAP